MKKLVVIDSNSVMHRAFHAIPPMNSEDGTPTNAIYGFVNILLRFLENEKPDYVLAAFDTPAPTPRHIEYTEYKAKRPPTADDLRVQFTLVKELLSQMGIQVGEKDGFEADDFLGVFSRRGEAAGCHVRLLTGDRDALQLVTPATEVVLMRKGVSDTVIFDVDEVEQTYGVTPAQMLDVKGLMGDSSDNIPGVPGVGEKTALKLIRQYGTMEEVLAHAGEVSGPKLRSNLQQYAEQAHMSRRIGTIVTDESADIAIAVEECAFSPDKLSGGREMINRLGMRSLVKRLPTGGEGGENEKQESVLPVWSRVEICTDEEWMAQIPLLLSAEHLAFVLGENISVSDGKTVWFLHVRRDLLSDGFEESVALEKLCIVMSSVQPKRFFDAKAWMHRYDRWATAIEGECFDAMMAAYLLEPGRSAADEAALAEERLDITEYHAGVLDVVCDQLKEALKKKQLDSVFEQIEMPLVSVLHDMEATGFLIDRDVLRQLGAEYDASIRTLGDEIHELAGNAEFNILSPKQLGLALFEEMGLPAPRKGKNGYPTDAATLEGLQADYPIVGKVLEYRQNTKLKSTYIDGLLQAADDSGRVHTIFKQNVTATGRLSSIEPNLQNIPVRSSLGREIRKAFIPSAGNILVSADYSQIELRILAHLSGDEGMIAAFQSGEDIHAATAAAVAGVSIDQVTPAMRSAAKATNFGIVYGISEYGLAQQLGVSRREAESYIESYYVKYPGVRRYMERTVEEAKETGSVRTIFGRKRDLPELRSSNYHTRSFGERAARNAPIQGSAADIIKVAMIRVHHTLKEKNQEKQLILQIHDELILDVPAAQVEEAKALVRAGMENVIELSVPLVVDVGAGDSWYSAK